MEKKQQDSKQQKPFKVIVVGGGLVAITAAHILSRANIEFVVLEQHDNLTPWIGSLLVMWPATYRMFNQLGIQDVMLPILNELDDYQTINSDDGSFLHIMKDVGKMWSRNHGYGIGVTARPQFLNTLYGCLPESAKARIRVKKRVTDIEVLSDGVCVYCEDGTAEEGTIVIGADGVHSRTRQCMEALATGKPGIKVDEDMDSPYLTTFRALIGNLPEIPDLKPRQNYQSVRYGVSVQLVTGEDRAWWYVYEALEQPTRRRRRYTEQDKKDMMEKYADLHVAPGYQLRDLYALNIGNIGLINLEEGRVDRWTWGGRIALVGDAVRKLDPHAGLGYNSGVGDVIELVNRLRRLAQSNQDSQGEQPTADMLQAEFDGYEKTRKRTEMNVHLASRLSARSSVWLNWRHRLLSTWVLRFFPAGRWMLDYLIAPAVAHEPVIEWLEETELPQGASSWVHHPLPQLANKP
ncbi:putative monooxygenase [Xylaria sp. FL1042]|nr:putative monooxygenase [Xylaria sp. FL1042]